ncbi:MAG: glutamate 5-kinase [Lentisphaeria bacterium]|nr:glutamate 5-kinase [Lentisphaeria bacterium]
MDRNIELRKNVLKNCRQIVVKAGTRLLTSSEQIARLVDEIAYLRKNNFRVMLVTSGAVGMGMKVLGLTKRPRKLAEVQALAAVGQGKLMEIYERECARHGIKSAQLLLTASDLRSRTRYLNVMNCINALWENDVLPIVNENDSVSVDELKFGDNDILSAMLGSLTGSQLTVILTTESGLRERDAEGKLAGRISVVEKLSDSIRAMAQGTDNAEFSIGSMTSRLRAANLLMNAGSHLWIADGRESNVLHDIADGKDIGTLFVPKMHKIHSKKLWIGFFAKCAGRLLVDDGAADALISKGRSLLPSGVIASAGRFKRGDTVEIVRASESNRVIARGLVNFDSDECGMIILHKSGEIAEILKRDADAEVVHRDNLVLLTKEAD